MNPFEFGLLIGSLSGLLVGGGAIWFWSRSKSKNLKSKLVRKISELEKQHAIDVEKLDWLQKSQDEIQETFQSLASQVLQTNTDNFLNNTQVMLKSLYKSMESEWKTQKEAIGGLVNPLDKKLSALDKQVRELEKKREGAYRSVEEQIKQLGRTHVELQRTTSGLSHALKSSSVRGEWGELQLRRLVELAGLTKHVDYSEQVSTDQGRPDMIIYLPNGGFLPIDAKAPMTAYFEAIDAEDVQTESQKLLDHVQAVRGHVRSLSKKQYWEQFDKCPEFVVMFIPNEASLSAAFENDPDLLEESLNKQVLISTPVTLLALLKAVAYGWQQFNIADNTRKIATEGKEMCSRIRIFASHLGDLGDSIGKAVEHYNSSIGSFERRLLPSIRRFEEMNAVSDLLTPPNSVEQIPREVEISDE